MERAPSTRRSSCGRCFSSVGRALLLAAMLLPAFTPSARAAQANSSTITSVDVAKIRPIGTFAGLAFRYIEGVTRGEVSAEEPIASAGAPPDAAPTVVEDQPPSTAGAASPDP